MLLTGFPAATGLEAAGIEVDAFGEFLPV